MHSAERGNVLFNFVFSDEEGDGLKPLKFDAYPCNVDVKDGKIHGFTNISSCLCSQYSFIIKF